MPENQQQSAVPASMSVTFPPAEKFSVPAQQMLQQASELVIDGDFMYEQANGMLKQVKAEWKDIEAERVKFMEPILQMQRNAQTLFKRGLDPRAQAETIIKNKMIAYQQEVERKREEERKERERLAEQERQRIAAEAAEKQRLADEEAARLRAIAEEEQRKADEAAAELRRKADEAAAQGRVGEAAALATEAEQATLAGQEKAAEATGQAELVQATAAAEVEVMQEVRTMVAAAPPATQAPVAQGVSIQKPWAAEVVDKAAALAYVAGNPQYHNLVEFDASALNKLAKALQKGLAIPGVRVFQKTQLNSR